MPIDTPSVIAVAVLVTGAVGALLIFSGWQNRCVPLLWWGAANLLIAGGSAVPLVSATLANGQFIEVANAAILLGYGVFWGGVRVFEKGSARLGLAAIGAVAWLVASQFTLFQDDPALRIALLHLISCAYATAAAFDVAAARRREPLISRNAAIFFLSIHAVILAGQATEALLGPHVIGSVSRAQLFAAFTLEHLLFTVAMAFILLAMMKERIEGEQKAKAYTDLLTSVPNRRAFFERGQPVLEACVETGSPAALALFDLDGFKGVNDTFGHAAGDRALVVFAEVAQAELRPKDLFARIGGEEFGCLMPGLTLPEAVAAAERIRLALTGRRIESGSDGFAMTVSAGVASSLACGRSLDNLLAGADRALYEAKTAGRNRVETAKPNIVFADGAETPPQTRAGSVVRAFRGRTASR